MSLILERALPHLPVKVGPMSFPSHGHAATGMQRGGAGGTHGHCCSIAWRSTVLS